VGTLEAMLQLSDLIGRLNGTLLPALRKVRFTVGAVRSRADGVTPAGRCPKSGQIGMTIGQMRSGAFPCGVHLLRRRFPPGKPGSVRVCSGKWLVLVQAVACGDFFPLGGSGCGLRGGDRGYQTRNRQGESCNSGAVNETEFQIAPPWFTTSRQSADGKCNSPIRRAWLDSRNQ